jgi:iron complex transport system ATP-binding protein
MKNVVELKRLSVVRGEARILDKIDWTVEPGQHWAVLGPNGSGKTSLLNVLAGYVTPGDGDLSVMGNAYGDADWREVRAGIGLVSSSLSTRINSGETALETVISGKYGWLNFWGRLFNDDTRRARQVLKLVNCVHLAKREWGTLSQGEKQRVLIARSLITKPKLLVLDEPCAGLDVVARAKFLRFLRHLGRLKNGPTLLMATHQVEEISPVFKHILGLRGGRVHFAGPIEDNLTSDNVSRIFGAPLKVVSSEGRYEIRLN